MNVPSSNDLYLLDWTSHPQSRICFSSMGAEILAGAYGVDLGLELHESILTLYTQKRQHLPRHAQYLRDKLVQLAATKSSSAKAAEAKATT